MKTILITGYNGFIGKHLVSNLAKKYHLTGLSNCKTNDSNIECIKGDITKSTFPKIKSKIHYIIHLAAMTDISICQQNPSECFKTNVLGTQNVLEFARKNDSKVIFVSSSHVYGNPSKLPLYEISQTNPLTVYGSSKLAGEIICKSYSQNYNLDISVLRLFSVYGKRTNGHDVISRIISQQNGTSIKLGNLFPKRDFVYIDDVLSAFKLLLKKTNGFEIYNIGTGKSTSIENICKFISKIQNKNLNIKSVKTYSRTTDIPEMRASISKITKLGWRPQISLYEGLEKTLEVKNE